ncbi:MAG TPA: spore coat protein [Desulfosporosinus sp.]|nr:spore coat protein [Desulfosporosinus sp.]
MNSIVENLTGMNKITDQVIASDFLIGAKTAVKDCATALTEASTPEVRDLLKRMLDDSIKNHERISSYMGSKGWYNAYNMQRQIQIDLQNADTALNLESSM